MFLGRVLIALVFEQRQRADQLWAGLGRLDYLIDEATLGGDDRGSSPTVREGVFYRSHVNHPN